MHLPIYFCKQYLRDQLVVLGKNPNAPILHLKILSFK